MFLPFHTFRKTPFNHSFLSKGIEFSAFFKNLFYHPSLLSQSMLFGGGGCCMPSFSFIILHCSVIPYNQEKYTTHSFDKGPNFIDIYIYISFKNLVYHPSCLSHSTLLEKRHSTTHSFLKGLSSEFFKNLFYHPSLLSQSMLLGGGGCCMPNFSFIILHCLVIPY